eukprot:TRINITY_DN20942_c0_g1_i1.p1 TRINITY_DN20942_c0_g1~~TRINITY_DN20942_c0_g1_i1.p1  ORF type:complete len:306 (-),score=82.42 TRINITY_DN20942_c0_g1_i1:13-930(-)
MSRLRHAGVPAPEAGSRPASAKLVRRSSAGPEAGNELIEKFAAESPQVVQRLMEPAFHTLNEDFALRKKLSQSLALLTALEREVPDLRSWHIVDLCCGKSLTSVLAALKHPGCYCTAVDRVPDERMPHYAEGGLGDFVRYMNMDVLAASAVPSLKDAVDTVGSPPRPAAILGMHLCGRLSEQAAKLFVASPSAALCLLAPCCMPALKDAPDSVRPFYTGTVRRELRRTDEGADTAVPFEEIDEKQYQAWCEHLCGLLSSGDGRASVEGTGRQRVEVRSCQVPAMFSIKRTMIVAVKPEVLARVAG